jgi:hypothetical protein
MSKRTPILSMTLGAGALVLVSVLAAQAQVQSSGQQACLNSVNKTGAAVAKTQGKEHLACLKEQGKTGVGNAQTCLTLDVNGKVAKAKSKTTAAATKSCGTAPSFGFTSAAAVNAAAQQADIDLVADVYGANLQPAVITCATSKAGCGCQQKISKSVEALAAVKLATFVSCKKTALKNGANSLAALAACLNDAGTAGSVAADTKGKIAKTLAGLNATIVKSCDTPGVTASAFPGACTALTGNALGTCLDTQVECRVCTAINAMDGLFVNCDLFDNGAADATCLSGTGPTPTPTPTLTPTPTATLTPTPSATATPGLFVGALARSLGRWTYNAMTGIAGGENACSTTFAGHLCTVAELQASETAGLLVGATDVNALAIDHFWAVDPAADDFHQCISAFPGVITRWAYATGHTASKGDFLILNNGTGALSSLNNGGLPVVCTAINTFNAACCQ